MLQVYRGPQRVCFYQYNLLKVSFHTKEQQSCRHVTLSRNTPAGMQLSSGGTHISGHSEEGTQDVGEETTDLFYLRFPGTHTYCPLTLS